MGVVSICVAPVDVIIWSMDVSIGMPTCVAGVACVVATMGPMWTVDVIVIYELCKFLYLSSFQRGRHYKPLIWVLLVWALL